jgi:hypothetical protein
MDDYVKNEDRALIGKAIYLGPGRLNLQLFDKFFYKIGSLLKIIL